MRSAKRRTRSRMSDEPQALVGNAADPKQIAEASRKEKDRRKRELAELRRLLDLPDGRRFLWRLLEHCDVFASVYDDVPVRMAHHSGKQDVGHFLLAEINDAQPTALLQMMREAKERTRA